MTKDDLVDFERQIADAFNRGEIRAPVHLAGGNEEQLVAIFREVRPQDWIFCQWRSHFHCLLKGVPPAELKAAIMAGHSITLCFPEHRVLSSAIAGGHLPIALGIAWQIKREKRDERVYAFMGDMTAGMGIAHECVKYADNRELPIWFVIEDNNRSVCTDTRKAWGGDCMVMPDSPNVIHYEYELNFPHAGAGVRVSF